jgi:TP901 family phage tail tape measure protein
MASERAILEIVADANKAIATFKQLEQKFVAATDRMDLEAAQVDFDPASKSAKKLRSEVTGLGKAMEQQGKKAKAALSEIAKHSRTGEAAQKKLASQVRLVDKDLRKAGAAGKRFGRDTAAGAATARKGMAGLAGTMKTLATTMGAISIPFLATGVIRGMASFESSMSEVLAVTQATTEEFERLNNSAISLGKVTVFTTTQVAEGMALLGRAGFKTNEIIAATPGLLDLAASGSLGLNEAVNIASNTLRAFNLEAAEMGRVGDILSAAASNSNTSIIQLGEGLKLVGPVAAAAGISLADTAAAMGVLSNRGLQATLAGTGLRATLAAMANPTKRARDAIESMGLAAKDLDPQMNSLYEIAVRLREGNLGLAEAFDIAGRRGGTALLSLASAAGELQDLSDTIHEATGRAREMADTMQQNLAGSFKRLTSAMDGLIQRSGRQGLSGVFTLLVDLVKNIIKTFDQSMAVMIDLLKFAVAPLTGALTILLGVFEAITKVVAGSINLFERLIGVQIPLTARIDEQAEAFENLRKRMGKWTVETVTDMKGVKAVAKEAFDAIKVSAEEQIVAIEHASERFQAYVKVVREGGEATKEARASIITQSAQIEEAIGRLPKAEKEAMGDLIELLRGTADQFRETGKTFVDVTEERLEQLEVARIAEDDWIKEVAGSVETLDEQAAAILKGTNFLKENGLVTKEVGENIRASVVKMIEEFKKFGLVAPEALRALVDEFSAISDEADVATTAIDKFVASVAGSTDKLREETEVIISGVEAIREKGEINKAVAENVGKAIDRLLKKYIAFGLEAPEALKKLSVEFPLLAEAAKKASESIKKVGEAATKTSEEMAKLAEESERAKEALAALKAAEAGQTDAEKGTAGLRKEIEGLEDALTLTVEEANRLTEAKGELVEQEALLAKQTASVTEHQVEYQNAVEAGIASQDDFSKVLVQTEGELKHVETAAAGAGDSIFGMDDAAARVADSLKSMGDGTSLDSIAEGAEKAGTALEKMADETESMKALAAEAEAAGERITIAFTAAAAAVGSLVTQTEAARHACASLKECMRETT